MTKLYLKPALTPKDLRTQQTILDNARAIYRAGVVTTPVQGGWEGLVYIKGSKGNYAVDAAAGRCACAASSFHGDCKHRIAVALQRGLVTLDDLVVVEADVRRAV